MSQLQFPVALKGELASRVALRAVINNVVDVLRVKTWLGKFKNMTQISFHGAGRKTKIEIKQRFSDGSQHVVLLSEAEGALKMEHARLFNLDTYVNPSFYLHQIFSWLKGWRDAVVSLALFFYWRVFKEFSLSGLIKIAFPASSHMSQLLGVPRGRGRT